MSNWPFRTLAASFSASSLSIVSAALLDQPDDVAHAEDAAGDAVGMERLERVELLADADQLDRPAGDRAHRQRRAAARIAVDPGQHDAGDAGALVEGLGDVDRVLAGHGVGDEQRLLRLGRPRGSPRPRASAPRRRGAARRCRGSPRRSPRVARLQRPPGDGERHLDRHDRQGGTPICRPRIASCSCAAGRRVSSEAIMTFLRLADFSR